jgi:hypothetical protein
LMTISLDILTRSRRPSRQACRWLRARFLWYRRSNKSSQRDIFSGCAFSMVSHSEILPRVGLGSAWCRDCQHLILANRPRNFPVVAVPARGPRAVHVCSNLNFLGILKSSSFASSCCCRCCFTVLAIWVRCSLFPTHPDPSQLCFYNPSLLEAQGRSQRGSMGEFPAHSGSLSTSRILGFTLDTCFGTLAHRLVVACVVGPSSRDRVAFRIPFALPCRP